MISIANAPRVSARRFSFQIGDLPSLLGMPVKTAQRHAAELFGEPRIIPNIDNAYYGDAKELHLQLYGSDSVVTKVWMAIRPGYEPFGVPRGTPLARAQEVISESLPFLGSSIHESSIRLDFDGSAPDGSLPVTYSFWFSQANEVLTAMTLEKPVQAVALAPSKPVSKPVASPAPVVQVVEVPEAPAPRPPLSSEEAKARLAKVMLGAQRQFAARAAQVSPIAAKE